eukprot:TRINITY_DN7588_c0_g1_i1.p1 TRINITY_DN7588_c0_g1~~TRINITY_DN7588_c0_g1_i1.p1  ORF type:complete len:124 (-),score=50.86 TRINITY_DN7588_c0_g1_i1:84-455(-)
MKMKWSYCGVFDDSDEFDKWSKKKDVRKQYGTSIKRIKMAMHEENKKKQQKLPAVEDIGMEMEAEREEKAPDEEEEHDAMDGDDDEDAVSEEESLCLIKKKKKKKKRQGRGCHDWYGWKKRKK